MPEKICSACDVAFPATLEFFHSNQGGKFGLRGQCRDCRRAAVREQIKQPDQAASRAAYAVDYIASGKNALRDKAWREKNIIKARESTASWKLRNPDRTKDTNRKWRENNRDKVRAKQRRADAKAQKSPIHVLNRRVKGRIRGMLNGVYPPGKIGLYLEFTKAELVEHIKKQFTDGMNWDRLLMGDIHIDHVIPVSSFDIKEIGDSEFRACWCLGNLRPLWADDNWKKRNQILTLL